MCKIGGESDRPVFDDPGMKFNKLLFKKLNVKFQLIR